MSNKYESMSANDVLSDETDFAHLLETTEQLVSIFTYRMLGKVIHHAAHEGELKFTSLPMPVVKEIRQAQNDLKQCEKIFSSGEEFGRAEAWFLYKAIQILEDQGEAAIEKYHCTFISLIKQLEISDEYNFAFETFARVSRKLFGNDISWGRIVALLCFGIEICVYIVEHGKPGLVPFLKKVIHYVVKFVKEEIMDWIGTHGGWVQMIVYLDDPNCPDKANHILAVMALYETTDFELWLKRVVITSFLIGMTVFTWKRLK